MISVRSSPGTHDFRFAPEIGLDVLCARTAWPVAVLTKAALGAVT